ncbi:hypothetical protein [Bradyrhizobium sp. LA7.1]|uniref:hypothetical protein n=1 Tax=Bradyrhizobium sp. LA7.1 TaxID=3156324 RepID=UPI00339141FE
MSANRRERDRDDGAADEQQAAAQAPSGEQLGAALRADDLGSVSARPMSVRIRDALLTT